MTELGQSARPLADNDPKGRGCWYFISQWYCVLCGKSEEIRERRWTPRPERPEDRHDYREEACGVHFC